ncbi:MAG: hypothetical protein FD157_1592 [Rhodocyclaceae bacterium]|nr:MAG: hypothetical protein FD157_1592 [Rhodocyclaceae bacterium]TND01731.1 MAG: hypothetical protein FD118_2325 [Rhodocyclaceae bacterium]
MTTPQVEAVARVLAEWNPLGDAAKKVTDLDGYRVEAADIVFGLKIRGDSVSLEKHVMDVLNQAFELKLDPQSCAGPAKKIAAVLAEKD